MTTCNSYDEKFFETFQQSLQQQNPNLPASLRSVHAVQEALQECESLFSSAQKQNEIPEVFSVRRSDNISDAFSFPSVSEWVSEYASGMKPVRVVGFVQELDTETSLLDSSPKHFARNIVLNGQVEQEDSSNGATTEDGNDGNQSQQVFTECTSLFITPIPGFKYHQHVEEKNSQLVNNREEQQKSSCSTKKRNLQPNSPLIDKKRSRVEIDEKNSNNQNQSNIENSNTKKARLEDEDDDREDEENKNQQDNSNTKPSSKAATTTSILSYGDEDLIRKNEKENIESRKLWKDVLGLSLAPTHENLATGVVGLIPHASNENFSPPALFGLVEVFGFLIPPSSDSQNEENLENNNNINLSAYDDFDLLSSSRFHTMPETVCPRLLILKWNRLESVEEAHEKILKIKNNNNNEEQQQDATFQSLVSFIQNKIFSNVGSSNTSANAVSKALLIHLVTSVIIRNESGAFGDLPLAIEVVESEEENLDADGSFFNSFVSRISSLVQSLRPCSMTCDVEYGLLLSSRINISNHQNHSLQLTHPSSVIARLDYEKQAVSSCLFSLPHGAEMILAVDDISHHHNHQNRHRQERKSSNGVQQSVFFNQNKNSGSEKIISTPLLQEQQQFEQKAIANYSRNINVLADLLIQQKLPILFGPRCEVSIERDLGILFLVRTAKDTKMSNNNNLKNKKSDQRLSEDSSNVADAENIFLPYFGTDDIFIPLKFRSRRHNQQNNNCNEASPQEIESLIKNNNFEKYFSNARQRYLSCAGTYQNNNCKNESNNNENSYFENNDNGEGDKYFEATFNQLRSSSDNVGWSTAMIKHSMPNVLLTMARARAVLGGRRLVRKSDIDEAKEILIELRRS